MFCGEVRRYVVKIKKWVGEMSQQLRALAPLAEDPGLIPRTHMVVQNHLKTTIPGDLKPSSDFLGHQAYT